MAGVTKDEAESKGPWSLCYTSRPSPYSGAPILGLTPPLRLWERVASRPTSWEWHQGWRQQGPTRTGELWSGLRDGDPAYGSLRYRRPFSPT